MTTAEIGPTQFQIVRDYLDARDKSERAAALAKKRKERLDAAEAKVLDLYQAEGVGNVRVDDRLVSIRRTLQASPKAGMEDDLVGALCFHGYGDLVRERVMSSTLAAWVRERDRDEDPIPDDIAQYLNIAEMFGLSVRRS